MRHLVFMLCLTILSGCTAIANWADDMGQHMPVIGERCEHWQCITGSGRDQSDEYKTNRQYPDSMPSYETDEESEPQERKRFPSPPQ